jgi:hypothetical protein
MTMLENQEIDQDHQSLKKTLKQLKIHFLDELEYIERSETELAQVNYIDYDELETNLGYLIHDNRHDRRLGNPDSTNTILIEKLKMELDVIKSQNN